MATLNYNALPVPNEQGFEGGWKSDQESPVRQARVEAFQGSLQMGFENNFLGRLSPSDRAVISLLEEAVGRFPAQLGEEGDGWLFDRPDSSANHRRGQSGLAAAVPCQ
ncbi:MAG: hypothetical protein U9R25_19780 [Chloroflexota bacterium]|nr:hypothetical protein [Chloroflexota bacterium]